eukprot:COSAG02_NODE_919_length_15936_cov_5.055314_18_plen_89_part_00
MTLHRRSELSSGRAIRLTSDRAIQSGLDRIENVVRPQNHARGGRAHLDVVLPDLFAMNEQRAEFVNSCTRSLIETTDRYARTCRQNYE